MMVMPSPEEAQLENIAHSQRFKTWQFNDFKRMIDVIGLC